MSPSDHGRTICAGGNAAPPSLFSFVTRCFSKPLKTWANAPRSRDGSSGMRKILTKLAIKLVGTSIDGAMSSAWFGSLRQAIEGCTPSRQLCGPAGISGNHNWPGSRYLVHHGRCREIDFLSGSQLTGVERHRHSYAAHGRLPTLALFSADDEADVREAPRGGGARSGRQ